MPNELHLLREKLEVRLAPISDAQERISAGIAELLDFHAGFVQRMSVPPAEEAAVLLQSVAFGLALIAAPTVDDIDKRLNLLEEDLTRFYTYVKAQLEAAEAAGMAGG